MADSARDPEKELRDLQRRFTGISRRYTRSVASRRFLASAKATVLIALLVAGLAFLMASAIL